MDLKRELKFIKKYLSFNSKIYFLTWLLERDSRDILPTRILENTYLPAYA
jgi:hypothetical protein